MNLLRIDIIEKHKDGAMKGAYEHLEELRALTKDQVIEKYLVTYDRWRQAKNDNKKLEAELEWFQVIIPNYEKADQQEETKEIPQREEEITGPYQMEPNISEEDTKEHD